MVIRNQGINPLLAYVQVLNSYIKSKDFSPATNLTTSKGMEVTFIEAFP